MSVRESVADAVFLYEDDAALAQDIIVAFAAENMRVIAARDETELVDAARKRAKAFILDRMIGGRDSLALLERMRRDGFRVPVVVISSLASVDDRIRGLKAGGDDYLVKPFAMGELIARVEAIGRRAEPDRQTRLTAGPLTIDLIDRSVRRGSREIPLAPREFGLLEYLMRHAGHVVTRAMILEDVWNHRYSTQTNLVDVHVGNLRRKIDLQDEKRLIESVRGLGFRIAASADQSG